MYYFYNAKKSSEQPQVTYISVYCFIFNAPTIEGELLGVLVRASSLPLLVVDRVFTSRETQGRSTVWGLGQIGLGLQKRCWEKFQSP